MMRTNREIELAREFLHSTGANLFLTGKAGTGKTTFLRSVVQNINKRVVVAAPTGVAAINARGVTLHSLFQLPFGINLPDVKVASEGFAVRKIGRKKLALIRSIELLVIDEISMVRCDLLDAVDETLRRIRRSSAPFGGVQLLMIGDVEQLSPICPDAEWALLREHYASPYFFSSKVLQRCNYVTIELKEIFRQRDDHFTALLNAVRQSKITKEVVDRLNERYIPNFEPAKEEGYITLTTHNATANAINSRELHKLTTRSHTFEARVKGDYPESAYPNDFKLELKVGAQVIFIKNDTSPEKLYYNGLIGHIEIIEGTQVTVRPNNGGDIITLGAVEWENVEYKLSAESGEIEESIKGTFSQIPLRCAWAITIHKSQGLSFDRAIIDAGNSFAHGQVYVALSRCRTFEGMVLRTPISGGSIIRDNTVGGFTEEVVEREIGERELSEHRREYYYQILAEIFDFDNFNRITYTLSKLLNTALFREYPQLCRLFNEAVQTINAELQKVGEGFRAQLRRIVELSEGYATDPYLVERLAKGSVYFGNLIAPMATLIEESTKVRTDAKELSKRLKTLVAEAQEALAIKELGLKSTAEGFEVESYLKAKFAIITEPEIAKPKASKAKAKAKELSADIVNEELYEALVAWRLDQARTIDKPAFTVLTNRSLIEIQALCPTSAEKLLEINGIGESKVKRFGDQIIEIVREYKL